MYIRDVNKYVFSEEVNERSKVIIPLNIIKNIDKFNNIVKPIENPIISYVDFPIFSNGALLSLQSLKNIISHDKDLNDKSLSILEKDIINLVLSNDPCIVKYSGHLCLCEKKYKNADNLKSLAFLQDESETYGNIPTIMAMLQYIKRYDNTFSFNFANGLVFSPYVMHKDDKHINIFIGLKLKENDIVLNNKFTIDLGDDIKLSNTKIRRFIQFANHKTDVDNSLSIEINNNQDNINNNLKKIVLAYFFKNHIFISFDIHEMNAFKVNNLLKQIIDKYLLKEKTLNNIISLDHKNFSKDYEKKKDVIIMQIKDKQKDILKLEKRYKQYMNELKEFNAKVVEYSNKPALIDNLDEQIKELSTIPSVDMVFLSNNRINIITHPLEAKCAKAIGMLNGKRADKTIDYLFSFNKMNIVIEIYDNEVYVKVFPLTKFGSGYWHIHVGSDGNLCLGDINMKSVLKTKSLSEIVSVVLILLRNINLGSPYGSETLSQYILSD